MNGRSVKVTVKQTVSVLLLLCLFSLFLLFEFFFFHCLGECGGCDIS